MGYLSLFLVIFSSSLSYATTPGSLLAGTASREISVTTDTSMGGFGSFLRRDVAYDPRPAVDRHLHLFKYALGQLDPVRAKAVVLKTKNQKLLFLNLDLLLLPVDLRDELLQSFAPLGFQASEVILTATHTHSGPGGFSDKPIWDVAVIDLLDSGLKREIILEATEAVAEANQKVEPARLLKSYFPVAGLQKNRSIDNGPSDPLARVLYIQSLNGNWLGAFINYAIHGTAMYDDNLLISSDIPGSLERNLEAQLKNLNHDANIIPTALFVSSPAGDIDPLQRGYDFVKKAGADFASAAMLAIKDAKPLSIHGWSLHEKNIVMNRPVFNGNGCGAIGYDNVKIASSYAHAFEWLHIPVSWLMPKVTKIVQLQMGDLRILTFPGEMTTMLHQDFMNQLPQAKRNDVWFFTLTDDYLLYFPRQEDFNHFSSLENCLSVYGPEGGKILLGAHQDLLKANP